MSSSRPNPIVTIIGDTGVGFALASFIFYSHTSTLGCMMRAGALLLITTGILLRLYRPASQHMAAVWLRNPRNSLIISGTSLLGVATCIFLQSLIGSAEASPLHQQAAIGISLSFAAFCTSCFFGVADILFAYQLHRKSQETGLRALIKAPETFLFLGYCSVSFMQGNEALFALPFIFIAFAVTCRNMLKNGITGRYHPVAIYACATVCFAAVAYMHGNMTVFVANIIILPYLLKVDMAQNDARWEKSFITAR